MSDQPKVQGRNADMVDLLSTDFVKRNEPNYAWKSACASILALPALRAFWPMSSVDYTTASRARDVAGGGYHLSDNNTVTFGYDQLVPYAQFVSASSQYLSRADGGAANWADILGTEAYVVAAQRGLTIGGWFWFDNAAGAFEYLSNKWTTGGNQRSYALIRRDTGLATFNMSTDGIATTGVNSNNNTVQSAWQFIAGRFTPSTEVKVWLGTATGGLDTNTNVAAIPALVFDSTGAFYVGTRSAVGNYMDGRASLCWLCAAALSDSIVGALYQNTRKAFNV